MKEGAAHRRRTAASDVLRETPSPLTPWENFTTRDANEQKRFRDRMRQIAADSAEARAYVMKLSMLASLRRAEEIQ